jgi:hypothetical protein
LPPLDLSKRMQALKGRMSQGGLPDDWFGDIAECHRELLARREDPATLAALQKWVVDPSQPAPLRSIAALLLGSLSAEGRRLLSESFPRLDGETGRAALFGLALRDAVAANVDGLVKYWQAAVLVVSHYGVVYPDYDRIYKNLKLGLPPDPGAIAPGIQVDLPTEDFESSLTKIRDKAGLSAAVAFLLDHHELYDVRMACTLLPGGHPDVTALAKELFGRQDVTDKNVRTLLIDVTAEGGEGPKDLTWMYSFEPSADLRARILSLLTRRGDPSPLVPLIVREISSPELSDASAVRSMELLRAIKDPSFIAHLEDAYVQAQSDGRKMCVVQALQGIPENNRVLEERVTLLRKICGDPSGPVRTSAIQALCNLPISGDARTSLLNELLGRESDESIKAVLRQALNRN